MLDTTLAKERLTEELVRITSDLEAIAVFEPETGDWVVAPDHTSQSEADENAEADAFEDSEERQATLASLETSYRNVRRALDKIEMGSFGTCEICQTQIETERIEFLPTARTCKAHRDDERTLAL